MRRDVFHALSDPTRREILVTLIKEKQNVNTIAEQYSMSRQAVSLHLKILQECNMISIEKQGRERYCKLEVEKLQAVSEWLEPFRKIWESKFNQLDKLLNELKKKEKNKK